MRLLKRNINNLFFIVCHDILMMIIAWGLAYWLRLNLSSISAKEFFQIIKILPLVIVVQLFFYWYYKVYRGVWRFTSVADLVKIIKAVLAACVFSVLIMFLFTRLTNVPRSIFPLYGLLLIMLMGGMRLGFRYFVDRNYRGTGKRVLIIGAGQAGESLVRDLLRDKKLYCPIGFIDDDVKKIRKEIHGVSVLGSCADIKNVVEKLEVGLIIIAIPSASAVQMQEIVALCRETKIPFQTVPGINDLTSGRVSINALREVLLEDLLGREQVDIDWSNIQSVLSGKVILISGGGGSIGSELCRQIANLGPSKLIVVEHSEYNLYKIEQELRLSYPNLNFSGYLITITNRLAINHVFQTYKPEIVFHAAAYKHVPMLEHQVYSAIYNNVIGTKIIADAAQKSGVEKFILISSDKAVNPTNIMGASKRLAEIYCQSLNQQNRTQYIAVRFGNVLGSSGSVIPLFREQLQKGGPITVTHPDVTRFFMTIPEAVCLILQAGILGKGGELFVLDMGEPVKIKYLAEQIIRLSGKEPNIDIQIVFTGLRPGEKLYEELFYKHEEVIATAHKKIFQTKTENIYKGNIDVFNHLDQLLELNNIEEFVQLFKIFIPDFYQS